MHEGASDERQFRRNRLRIVTYNYDQSLERFFESVLRNMYSNLAGQPDGAVAKYVEDTIPVVHLHGSLGPIGDQVWRAHDRDDYRSSILISQMAAGLRIVHEESESDEYATAQEWLCEAEAIYFLGFGYHPTNVQRLNLASLSPNSRFKDCRGMAYGMEAAERRRAEAALGLTQNILHAEDCLMFLRRIALLE